MPTKPRIRTGILGGSFNPIHLGHTALAQAVLQAALVDELWFLVSPHNPLKDCSGLADERIRLEMARAATKDLAGIEVSDFEFGLPRPSYMVNTLGKLESAFPERAFSLVIGADNWACFDQWFRYEEILQRYPLIVYPREGYSLDSAALPPSVTALDAPLFPISATDLRSAIASGSDCSEWLHPEVERICRAHALYI